MKKPEPKAREKAVKIATKAATSKLNVNEVKKDLKPKSKSPPKQKIAVKPTAKPAKTVSVATEKKKPGPPALKKSASGVVKTTDKGRSKSKAKDAVKPAQKPASEPKKSKDSKSTLVGKKRPAPKPVTKSAPVKATGAKVPATKKPKRK